MSNIKALVLRAAGINCDKETAFAFEQAGASSELVHINQLIDNPAYINDFQIMVFPGGFSYGDDVAAGKILANQIIHHLQDMIHKFIDDSKLVLGICNGFQILVKAGILPAIDGKKNLTGQNQAITITYNDSGKFEDRWVYLKPETDKCAFISDGQLIYLPIAHGEGKVLTQTPEILEQLKTGGHIAFRYVDAAGNKGGFPVNPNGSTYDIAGLTDSTGRVLGLMPHPERYIKHTQHPHWTRIPQKQQGDGMGIFANAINYFKSA